MRRSPYSVLHLALTETGYALVFGSLYWGDTALDAGLPRGLIVGTGLFFCASSLLAFLVRARAKFRVVLVVQALVLFVLQSSFALPFTQEVGLAAMLIVSVTTYEKYPQNLLFALLFVALSSVFRLGAADTTPGDGAVDEIGYIFLAGLVAALGALVTLYRERIIPLQQEIERLENAVSGLTQANLSYQNFAERAQEAGILQERKRITRDIHDTVGYTLTNITMMLNAVKLMALKEPDKIPEQIDRAREDAEGALAEIRRALHDLRESDRKSVSGIHALTHLVRTFGGVTGIHVRLEYGNFDWDTGPAVDSIIYHFVQEGMINAFRHGKAHHIDINFWRHPDVLQVSMRDDGVGASSQEEGIGLRGMKERLDSVDGRLEATSGPTGFRLAMQVPLRR